MSDKVSMYCYGVRITYDDTLDVDKTETDDLMKKAMGFVGYDDQVGSRFYFYLTGEHRDAAVLKLINHKIDSELLDSEYAVQKMREPVRFEFLDWMQDSTEEMRL